MDTKHAPLIDRIGREVIRSHFNITPRAIQKWRANGIPGLHHNTMRYLGAIKGVSVRELDE